MGYECIKVFWWYHTEAAGDIPEKNITTNGIEDLERWPGLVGSKRCEQNGMITIRGKWHPHMLQHNPLNDGEIPTWSPTGAVPLNSWLEQLRIAFKIDHLDNTYESTKKCCNVRFEATYKVQFRGLKHEFFWPARSGVGSGAIELTVPAITQDVL